MPVTGERAAFISSGTWSLVGTETDRPVLTEDAYRHDFTNEGGVGGRYRFLKNVMGLWLLQGCRRSWEADRDYTYAELAEMAATAKPFTAMVDPDWPGFLNPHDMPAAIIGYCRRTGQEIPVTPAQIARVILESLALKYRLVLDQMAEVLGWPAEEVHILGGGGRNELLCQFTADASGLPVEVGPFEATAMGNLLVQALALGLVADLEEIRQVVRASIELRRHEPADPEPWQAAYERYKKILARPPEEVEI
jgi:rhamnulokinase